MNKAECIADLKSRVKKVYKEHDVNTLNGGDKEYSFECVVRHPTGGFYEDNYSIRVIDEGLDTEDADYVNGKEPPAKASDLEIGLALLLQEDPSAVVLAQVSDKLFKVKFSDDTVKLVTLTPDKKGLLKAPSVV